MMFRHAATKVGTACSPSLEVLFGSRPSQSGIALFRHLDASKNLGTKPQKALHLLANRHGRQNFSSLTSTLKTAPSKPFRRKWPSVEPTTQPSRLKHLAFSAWIRHAHTRSKRRRMGGALRTKRTVSNGAGKQPAPNASAPKAELSPKARPTESAGKNTTPAVGSHLLDRLPQMPHLHRPTKEELLAAATGAWSRFKIHFKWFSIKSARPFNMDDISAFFSWILVGHVVWFVVGTTTFFSLIIFMVNTVLAQGTLPSECVLLIN
jgi:distribution and morphology protein 31